MDGFSLSLTGPFGSELIPNSLSPEEARDAAMLFAMFISGEAELASHLEAALNRTLHTGLKGAITMIVERARRSTEHAPAPALLGRDDARAFLVNNLRRALGKFVSAVEVYRAYEGWAREGSVSGTTRRPIEARRFHHIVSMHFDRIVSHNVVGYRDIEIIRHAAPLATEGSFDRQEPK